MMLSDRSLYLVANKSSDSFKIAFALRFNSRDTNVKNQDKNIIGKFFQC